MSDAFGWWEERSCRWGFVRWGTGLFQFRVFGWGVSVLDSREHAPLFSERNGFVRVLRVGKWRVRLLRPQKSADYTKWRVQEQVRPPSKEDIERVERMIFGKDWN